MDVCLQLIIKVPYLYPCRVIPVGLETFYNLILITLKGVRMKTRGAAPGFLHRLVTLLKIPNHAKMDLNKKFRPMKKTIQTFKLDAQGFQKTMFENPPTQKFF